MSTNVRDRSPEARTEVFKRIIKAATDAARVKARRKEKRTEAADRKFLRAIESLPGIKFTEVGGEQMSLTIEESS